MPRLFPSLVPRLILLSFLAVVACAAPALADLVSETEYLSGVTLVGGGTAYGVFHVEVAEVVYGQWWFEVQPSGGPTTFYSGGNSQGLPDGTVQV